MSFSKIVEAYLSHEDNIPYYRTLPNRQLICIVDGAWHTAIDDNTWEEPVSPIPEGYEIKIVKEPT